MAAPSTPTEAAIANGTPAPPSAPPPSVVDRLRATMSGTPPAPTPGMPDAPAAPAAPAAAEGADPTEFQFDDSAAPPEGTASPQSPPSDPTAAQDDPNAPKPPVEAAPDQELQDLLSIEGTLTKEQEDRLRGAFLATPGGRRMLEAKQIRSAIEAPPDIDPQTGQNRGGLGRFPTREEILRADAADLAMLQMEHDFQTNPSNWIANFFGYRDAQGKFVSRDGAADVLSRLPEHLRESDPSGELHRQTATAFLQPYLGQIRANIIGLIQSSPRNPDGTFAKSHESEILRRTQGLHDLEVAMGLEPERIPGISYDGSGEGYDPNKPDPLAAERKKLADQKAAHEAAQKEAAQARYAAATQGIETQILSRLRADANQILQHHGLSGAYPKPVYDRLVNEFVDMVVAATSGDPQQGKRPTNPNGFRSYQIHADRAARGQLDPNRPVQIYSQLARTSMRTLVKQFVTANVPNAAASANAMHDKAQAAANRTEVPSGAPVGAAPAPMRPQRPAGMDDDEWTRERLKQTMMQGTSAAAVVRH